MNLEKIIARRRLLSAVVCTVLLSFAGFIYIFHRSTVLESHGTLQGGRKMDVRLTLQSTWRWQVPDRLADLHVAIGGVDRPVNHSALTGLDAVDNRRPPLIVESRGFPEILIFGPPGRDLEMVCFRFQNNAFSERRITHHHETETAYFASPLPTPIVTRMHPVGTPMPFVSLSSAAVHPVTPAQQ